MTKEANDFEHYFSHLKNISLLGRIYKRCFSSPLLYFCARSFGSRIIEIGSGAGNGVLGAFPRHVIGLDINPVSVAYCQSLGMNAQQIKDDGIFPVADGVFDVCILDNVLEHIDNPRRTLDECYRITTDNAGLVIAVPGIRGYQSDDDHKIFYGADELRQMDQRWALLSIFSIPFIVTSERMSKSLKQYCLVAIYTKV